jgi:hypothetical protein
MFYLRKMFGVFIETCGSLQLVFFTIFCSLVSELYNDQWTKGPLRELVRRENTLLYAIHKGNRTNVVNKVLCGLILQYYTKKTSWVGFMFTPHSVSYPPTDTSLLSQCQSDLSYNFYLGTIYLSLYVSSFGFVHSSPSYITMYFVTVISMSLHFLLNFILPIWHICINVRNLLAGLRPLRLQIYF